MRETKQETKQEMLEKLNEFTRETGIIIGGCMCCGSPWVTDGDDLVDCLKWDEEKQEYV